MCNWPVFHPTRLWTKSGAGREVRVTHEFFLKLVTRSVRVSRSLCATRSSCVTRFLRMTRSQRVTRSLLNRAITSARLKDAIFFLHTHVPHVANLNQMGAVGINHLKFRFQSLLNLHVISC